MIGFSRIYGSYRRLDKVAAKMHREALRRWRAGPEPGDWLPKGTLPVGIRKQLWPTEWEDGHRSEWRACQAQICRTVIGLR